MRLERWGRWTPWTFSVGMGLLLLAGGLSLRALDRTNADASEMERAALVQRILLQAGARLDEAESAQKQFLLNAAEARLIDFEEALFQGRTALAEALRLTRDNPAQQRRLAELDRQLDARIALWREGIALARGGGADAAALTAETARGRAQMRRVLEILHDATDEEDRQMASRRRAFEAGLRSSTWTIGACVSLAVVLLAYSFAVHRAELRYSRNVEARLSDANRELAERMTDIDRRRGEIETLAELIGLLHASRDAGEVAGICQGVLPRMLPGWRGAIYSFPSSSRERVERLARWPFSAEFPEVFDAEDCWAIRRSQVQVSSEQTGRFCRHVPGHPAVALCVPISAAGEDLGILHLERGGAARSEPPPVELARAVAGQVGLAFANLALRARLREQSVRDALTGLFNRRYLEEALGKEISRAQRKGSEVSLVMIDFDNFKSFNDLFGHQAGDAVLRETGTLLSRSVRASDVACRYGGEEFLLVLPETGLAHALERTEELRDAFGRMKVRFRGEELARVTASFGIAVYPVHGDTPDRILAAADDALYRAKHAGRDRVEVARAA